MTSTRQETTALFNRWNRDKYPSVAVVQQQPPPPSTVVQEAERDSSPLQRQELDCSGKPKINGTIETESSGFVGTGGLLSGKGGTETRIWIYPCLCMFL